MSRRHGAPARRAGTEDLIEEAARLICDEGVADYGVARSKAAHRLGTPRMANSIDKVAIEARVIERQQLFGGQAYHDQLQAMREAGLRCLQLLDRFAPTLSGSAVTGAIGFGHRVQVHVVCEPAEAVELFLLDRRIPFQQDERRYLMADGREQQVPLLCLDAGPVGVDVAVFDAASERQPPRSQVDGRAARRLDAAALQALLAGGS